MSNCRRFVAFPPICMLLLLAGCSNPAGLDSVNVTPVTQSAAVGQTTQFTAIGTYGNASHPSTQTITNSVTWASGNPSVATVSASGVATAVGAGSTIITASATGYAGSISSTANLTVTGSVGGVGGGSGGSILSLTIIPSGIDFGGLGESGQFLAIGTFSTPPTVRDLTNSVTWITSEPNVFPITNNNSAPPGGGTENGGVVSAAGASSGDIGAVITAEATDSSGSIATATATVGCPYIAPDPTAKPPVPGSCYTLQTPLLVTLTFYNEGLNTTNWEVTAPSATGSPDALHCGPGYDGAGGSVCTATYPVNTKLILTAPAETGVAFGAWSSNCTPSNAIGVPLTAPPYWTAAGPNYCTITLTYDETVGAIFN